MLGLIDPLKVVAAAAIIKYVKYWWQKQQESKKLEREKINAELQLLKAQIHPAFLFIHSIIFMPIHWPNHLAHRKCY